MASLAVYISLTDTTTLQLGADISLDSNLVTMQQAYIRLMWLQSGNQWVCGQGGVDSIGSCKELGQGGGNVHENYFVGAYRYYLEKQEADMTGGNYPHINQYMLYHHPISILYMYINNPI